MTARRQWSQGMRAVPLSLLSLCDPRSNERTSVQQGNISVWLSSGYINEEQLINQFGHAVPNIYKLFYILCKNVDLLRVKTQIVVE